MSTYSNTYGLGSTYSGTLQQNGSVGNARPRKEPKVSVIFRHTDSQQHCSSIESLLLSPSENWLFTASKDSTIKRWNVASHQPTFEASFEGHVDWVNDVALLDDSLVSCSNDRTVKIWKASSPGQWVHTFMHHKDYVTSLAVAPGTNSVATAGLRAEISLIDLNAAKAFMIYPKASKMSTMGPPKEPGSIYALSITPNGSLLAAGTTQSLVRVLDPRSGAKIMKLRGHTDNVRAVALNADGTLLLSASSDKTIRLWDLGQQRCVQTIAVHSDSVWALLTNENFSVVYSAGRDKCLYRTHLQSRSSQLLLVDDHPISCMAINPPDGSLYVGSTSSTLQRWNLGDAPPFPSAMDLRSPSGRGFMVGGNPAARLRQSLDAPHLSGHPPEPLLPHRSAAIPGVPAIVRHSVLPDRRSLLTMDSEGNVAVWDVLTGTTKESCGRADFHKMERELYQPVSVPAWFTADHKLGCLTIHLEPPACFSSEVYAVDLGYPLVQDDLKLNFGKLVLEGVFHRWQALYTRLKAAEAAGHGGAPGMVLEDVVEEEAPRFDQPWPKYWDSSILPAVACQNSANVWARWVIDSFTGREREVDDIPQWVADCVLHNQLPVVKDLKCSFVLQPFEGSELQSLLQSRLNAPRILQVHKVATYCLSKLSELGIHMQMHQITWDPKENIPPPGSTPFLEITCNGVLVPYDMSLASVREFVWKKREDVLFHFRKLDRNNMPPLPKVMPPS